MALVSGANKGIGKEIARGLAKAGFVVLIGARKSELGEAAAAELAKEGQVSFQQLDVTDVKSVIAAAAAVKQRYGHLDVLVRPVCDGSSAHHATLPICMRHPVRTALNAQPAVKMTCKPMSSLHIAQCLNDMQADILFKLLSRRQISTHTALPEH